MAEKGDSPGTSLIAARREAVNWYEGALVDLDEAEAALSGAEHRQLRRRNRPGYEDPEDRAQKSPSPIIDHHPERARHNPFKPFRESNHQSVGSPQARPTPAATTTADNAESPARPPQLFTFHHCTSTPTSTTGMPRAFIRKALSLNTRPLPNVGDEQQSLDLFKQLEEVFLCQPGVFDDL